MIFTGTDDRCYFIERISADTRPEIDLEELAKELTPRGLLAERLLWLDEPAGYPQRDDLVARASRALQDQGNKPVWAGLDADEPDPVEWLRKAGLRALDQLLAQTPNTG